MKIRWTIAALIGSASSMSGAQPVDPDLARNLAATCANCHGTDGRARDASAALAGYPEKRLLEVIEEFRSGRRKATIMHQLVKGYTPEQMRLIAGYFAAQKN
jgi:sulfide dehydrogenase cytochrome subunit